MQGKRKQRKKCKLLALPAFISVHLIMILSSGLPYLVILLIMITIIKK